MIPLHMKTSIINTQNHRNMHTKYNKSYYFKVKINLGIENKSALAFNTTFN